MDTDGSIYPPSAFLSNVTALSTVGEPSKGILLLIVLFVAFVILGGYFGGSESAISAMNKIRMKAKADDGNKGAKNAMYLSNNFDKALTALLIGNNITHIAAASVATLIATRLFGTSDQGTSNLVTFLCTVITTLIVFFFSEMIPKSFANDRSNSFAMFISGSLRFIMKLLFPLVWFFGFIATAATKLTDKIFKTQQEPSITEDELHDIIDTIEEEGVMNEEQADLFESALDFSGTKARDVMTMREDILGIDIKTPIEKVLEIIQNTAHSRLLVYSGNLDNVVGILQIRTFLRAYLKDKHVNLRSLLLPAFRVSPNAKIDELLSEMSQHKFYLGVVYENGKTLGVVSIEDFLEELVGEIYDEDDVIDKNFQKLGGNYFRIDTHMTMQEAYRRMGQTMPKSIRPKQPLLSFVLEKFGKMPEEDDNILFENLEILAEDAKDGKLPYVTLHPMNKQELEEYKKEMETEGGKEA